MNTRKKILLCITKPAAGGAQKYICDIATHLPADTFETVVAAGDSGPLFDALRNKGIRTISIPGLGRDINPFNEIRAFCHLVRIFITEKPDVIHLNSSKMGAMGALAALASKLLTLNFKPRVLFTVHGWGFREDRNALQRGVIFAISWIAAFFHNHTITINSADYADARAFIPRNKISLIPLGISSPEFFSREQSRAFFSELCGTQIDDKTFLIGATAELTKNKGLPHLVDAIHNLLALAPQSKIHCVIMGEGEQREHLARQINTHNLEQHISLAGFVTDAYRYLPGLDLFALSSVKEGLPYALMEAMAAGLPVIASRVGGIPDLISHETNGLLAPAKDSHTLAAHVNDLLSSAEKRRALGQRAKQTILTRHSLERMIEKTSHLYDQPA